MFFLVFYCVLSHFLCIFVGEWIIAQKKLFIKVFQKKIMLILTAVAALIYLLIVVLQKLIVGIDVPGFATIIVLILLLGGMQLFCIGIIGEYVGKTFEQSKNRPIYVAKETFGCDEEK